MPRIDMDRLRTVLIYSVPVVFLVSFLIYPLLSVLEGGFRDDGGSFSLDGIGEIMDSSRSMGIISFTLVQALISTFFTIAFALPGAYFLSRHKFPGRSALLSLTTVPFVLPPLILGIGFLSVFGTNGWVQSILDTVSGFAGFKGSQVNILYSKEAIVLAHVFLNFPIALRILHSRLNTMDSDLIDASRSLGKGPLVTLIRIVIPQMRYSILSAASLIFTFCLLTFGVVLVVGGMSNATLEVEIYRQFNHLQDQGKAGILLLIEIFLVSISTAVYIWSSRKAGSSSGISRGSGIGSSPSYTNKMLSRIALFLYALLILIVVLGPMLSVVHDSFVISSVDGEHYSLHWYEMMLSRENDPTIGPSPLGAVLNSLLFGFLTVVFSVPLSMITAYALDRPRFKGKIALDTLLLFPIGVSTVALGIGMVTGFQQGWIDIGDSWIPILIVHTVIAYPLGARAILSAKREIPEDLIEAARSLGSSRARTFLDVEMPLLLPGIIIAMVFSFAISIGEFGATLMVAPSEYTTMPIALYKFISGGRDFGSATAYGVVIMLITFTSILFIDILGRRFGRRLAAL